MNLREKICLLSFIMCASAFIYLTLVSENEIGVIIVIGLLMLSALGFCAPVSTKE